MLKELKITNIILIEEAHIHFQEGFTVLSGETGAGKSAVMEALKLVLGARTDVKAIRHGAEKASITAVFDLERLSRAKHFLEEKGVESADPNLLILQRELTTAGKTKAYINHQPAQLNLLKDLGELLLEQVGQHANHKLFHLDQHRHILDLFGNHSPLRHTYETTWKSLEALSKELSTLQAALPGSLREIENCAREIKEIEGARFKEEEEAALFETYSLLASTNERLTAANELTESLGGERGVFALLTRGKPSFSALQKTDPKFAEELLLYPQVMVEVEELLHSLRRYTSKLDQDPEKLEKINDRLSFLTRFKRKYGQTSAEVHTYLDAQKSRLKVLENLEDEIASKTDAVAEKKIHLQAIGNQLTELRKKTALNFSKKMTLELHELNMKQAEFQIDITPLPLQLTGQDKIEFFLHTNIGEKRIALRESASGGEIARVLLALHVLLADKEKVGTLIFDEIDANIGGTTAAIMGDKLKTLGDALQIITITHFPQVAKCAKHHLQISKTVTNKRTLSQIVYLDDLVREHELDRMAGAHLG